MRGEPHPGRRHADATPGAAGAGRRARAVRRRLSRLRRRRDRGGRTRCRVPDRGRLRGTAGRRFDRPGVGARSAGGVGRMPGQRLFHPRRRRCGRRRGRDGVCTARDRARAGGQPDHRGGDGAARLHRRIRSTPGALHALYRAAEPAPGSRRACAERLQRRRDRDPRGERRNRRQLRHARCELSRAGAGAVGGKAHRPAGQMGLDPHRRIRHRRPRQGQREHAEACLRR